MNPSPQVGSNSPGLESYLQPFLAGLDPHLLSPSQHELLCEVATGFPGLLAFNTFGLELRLAEPGAEADLLFQASRSTGRRELSAALAERRRDAGDGPWRSALRLVDAWANDASDQTTALDHLWLEFDVASLGRLALPSIFFGFESSQPMPSEERAQVTLEALALVRSRALSSQSADLVHAACEVDAVEVFQVGAMCGRPDGPVRLCARLVEAADGLRFLTSLGAPAADIASIASELERIAPMCGYICVDVDLYDEHGLGRKVGLELYPTHGDAPWTALLEQLVDRGLCRAAKADALLQVARRTDRRSAQWPEGLATVDDLMGARGNLVLEHSLHHLKLAVHGNRREAKAYLAGLYRWC